MRDYKPDERVPGTVYRIVRPIGSGGMGTVYEVEDTTIGKHYVLKTLQPQLGSRGDLARRMQSEARTLARLAHPHIVEVITAGITGDDLRLPYFVMERLTGQSLRSIIQKKGRLEPPHAYHITLELLEALEHAHGNGVIHRDVKPDNIFLHRGPTGVTTTKLLDFGIVSLLDTVSRETGERFLGTLRYAAPEQLRGERPTPKVDIYAAGLVLYEMLAGRGPYDDEGESRHIAAAHLSKPAPPLSRFVPVPAELETVVASALAKAPDNRPRDAYSFASALRNVRRLFGVPPEAEAAAHGATDSGVMDSTAPQAAYVKVRQEGPGGPVVVAPGPAEPPTVAEPGKPLRTDFPTTTIRGMAPPTAAGSMVTVSPTATTPEAVDRNASTRTFASDSVRSPRNGTEPYSESETTTAPYAIASHPGGGGGDGGQGQEPHAEGGAAAGGVAPVRFRGRGRTPRVQMAVLAAGALLVATVLASVASVVRVSPAHQSSPSVSASVPPAPSAVASAAGAESPPASSVGAVPPPEPVAALPEPPALDTNTNKDKPKAVRIDSTRSSAPAPRIAERPGPGF